MNFNGLCTLSGMALRARMLDSASKIRRESVSATKSFSTSNISSSKPKTGILLLNMGGPQSTEEVQEYLTRLFLDHDVMKIPMQEKVGPIVAKRKTPSVIEKYKEIGGGSPIYSWTKRQGDAMCKILDEQLPASSPHKAYVGFRYAKPLTEETIEQMEKDGVTRAVAFSQFPQYSCATSGPSFNAIYEHYQNRGDSSIDWSFIDRWPTHPLLVKTFAENIKNELLKFDKKKRHEVVILFSAHSVPQYVMNRGDTYPAEVGATVQLVMDELGWTNPYRLVWQAKEGPLQWLSPDIESTIKALVKRGHKNQILVPISFVNEHIETLHELDIECVEEVGKEVGAEKITRCPAPNDHPLFIEALADIVKTHLTHGPKVPPQLLFCCPMCQNQTCQQTKDWIKTSADKRM